MGVVGRGRRLPILRGGLHRRDGVLAVLPAVFYFVLEGLEEDGSLLTHEGFKDLRIIRERCSACHLYDRAIRYFHPAFGCCLSLTGLRLPCFTAIQLARICGSGLDEDDHKRPSQLSGFALYFRGQSSIIILKLFELVCESIPELLLQTYVGALRYYKYGEPPGLWLASSLLISLSAVTLGVVSAYLSDEKSLFIGAPRRCTASSSSSSASPCTPRSSSSSARSPPSSSPRSSARAA